MTQSAIELPRPWRLAAGMLGFVAVLLVLPSIGAVLAAIGGRAPDFSGRQLDAGERLLYAGLVVLDVVAFGTAIAMTRGSRRAAFVALALGVVGIMLLGSQFMTELQAGSFQIQRLGGIAAIVVFEGLVVAGLRARAGGG
jgi:hypothetical protein